MPAGKACGANRDYQVLCRDILLRRAAPSRLVPYAGDGIDVRFQLGTAGRTLDVVLADEGGRLVVAECRRTKDPVKLRDLDVFACRVELLRKSTGLEVVGVYFTKTAYQEGVVMAAQDFGIRLAVCAQDQPLSSFSLMFHQYDAERHRRLGHGEAYLEDSIKFCEDSLDVKVIRADGSVEDRGRVA